jgi:Mlc titration factor MtfA (ptsG expression regulator)
MDPRIIVTIGLLSILVILFIVLFVRRKKRPSGPFPEAWRKILLDKVDFYRRLSPEERERFEREVLFFFQEIDITGVDVELTDSDRLLVAASGIIPLFGFPGWHYRNLNEVLLYKDRFNLDYQTQGTDRNINGMVGTGSMQRMMILSQRALHKGFRHADSRNVGIHEFVHLLDKFDGETDGLPAQLLERQYTIPWLEHVRQEMEAIRERKSSIRPYGATNQAEFFSVVSEYFFERPAQLRKKHPELFELLEEIFNQEPLDGPRR